MTEHETLYLVNKRDEDKRIVKSWVFRTRSAAREYVRGKNGRRKSTSKYTYTINRAVWGPEL